MKDEVLNDILGTYLKEWFAPSLNHPFNDLKTVSIPDTVKPIPKRWVDDVEVALDEGFGAEDGDLLGEGPATSWTVEEGQLQLRHALRRLDLSETHVSHPSLTRMNRSDLSVEKRRVKQELKRYDAEFRKKFLRLPSHTEKEPMRPLYVYYRKLKTMIANADQSSKSRRSGVSTQVSPSGMSDDESHAGGIPMVVNTRHTAPSPVGGQDLEAQITALEARVETLQVEKGAVRAKLQAFQETFVSENNRKIRFHKDILPIEREYRMYKNLKEEIVKAEAQLRDLQAR